MKVMFLLRFLCWSVCLVCQQDGSKSGGWIFVEIYGSRNERLYFDANRIRSQEFVFMLFNSAVLLTATGNIAGHVLPWEKPVQEFPVHENRW